MKVMKLGKSTKYMLLSLLVLLSAACTSSTEYTLGYWHPRSDFEGKARAGAAYFMVDNIGYIVGGHNTSSKRMKSMYSYSLNGTTDFFTELFSETSTATMPSARQDATGFAVAGKGYITCGYNGTDAIKETWEYTPGASGAAGTWRQVDDFPGDARYGALSFTLGNYAYVGCGYNDDGSLKDFYKYDPAAADGSHWTKVEGYGGSKRAYGMAFVINNVAYIVGGKNNNTDCKDMFKFDGTTWTRLRYITSDDDLVESGDDSFNDDYTSIVRFGGVAFAANGKGYIALGSSASGTYRANYWIYDPATDLWSNNDGDVTDFSGSTRIDACCFTFKDGRVFITTGGSGSSSYFDDTYEFSPTEYKEK
jgi:N-acetylneuraminic acid mutarotase